MNVLTIIQARTSSKRLPGKILLPLAGKPVLEHVIDRARQFSKQVIVATSTDLSDDAVFDVAMRAGVSCIAGPLNNVLLRFQEVIRNPRTIATQWICRVTADCPLIDVSVARDLISKAASAPEEVSLVGVTDHTPKGYAVELIRHCSLMGLDAWTASSYEREHVTAGLYGEAQRFPVLHLVGQPDAELNTWWDYRALQASMAA